MLAPSDVIERLQRRGVQALRLHERRPRRHARRARTSTRSRGSPRRSGGALHLLGRHRLARRPARAARAAAREPGGRDRRARRSTRAASRSPRQAALRPEASLSVLQAGDPLPRRRQGPRREGHELRRTCATPATRSSWPRATTPRAPTSSCSSTSPPRTRSATRSSSWPGAPPTTSSSRSRSAAGSARARTPRRCSTRAPTRCRSTRRRSRGPELIGELADDVRRPVRGAGDRRQATTSADGGYEVFVNGGRIADGPRRVEWAREGAERGAGEILLTSMDRDGTEDGYELELTRAVADGGRRAGDRLGRRRAARPPRRGGRARAAPTRCSARRSSTTGPTRSARRRSTCAGPASRCGCRSLRAACQALSCGVVPPGSAPWRLDRLAVVGDHVDRVRDHARSCPVTAVDGVRLAVADVEPVVAGASVSVSAGSFGTP